MRYATALCILALLGAPAWGQAPATVEATVAAVNGEYVYKSDVLWNLALDPSVRPEEFWRRRPQNLMLRTIIDQRLLLQDASRLPATAVGQEEVDAYIKQLGGRFNSPDDPSRFERRLALVGLTRERLERIVRERLQIEKYVDFRFRSFVIVTEAEVRQYFEAEVRPKLEAQTPEALEKVLAAERPKIEQVLAEEKITAAIDTYLEEARARAETVVFGRENAAAASGGELPADEDEQ
jgi:hypothetical protein